MASEAVMIAAVLRAWAVRRWGHLWRAGRAYAARHTPGAALVPYGPLRAVGRAVVVERGQLHAVVAHWWAYDQAVTR